MNVVLTGFGKMGRELYSVLVSRGHNVIGVVDPFSLDARVTNKTLEAPLFKNVDVVIDFSSPDNAVENIKKYIDYSIPAIIGTTGWVDRLEEVKAYGEGKDVRVMYSGNYSIGVALFLKLCRKAGELYGKVSGYDASIYEVHHTEKKDSPSGTALEIAKHILANTGRKTEIVTEEFHEKPKPEQLHVSSTRCGAVPGTHTVFFDSAADTIEITHRARSRAGFAMGAVHALERLCNGVKNGHLVKGRLYGMSDLF